MFSFAFLIFVILVISRFGFEGWIWVLIVSVSGLCIRLTFTYKVKLGLTGVYIIFLLFYVLSKNKKHITVFHLKIIIFNSREKSQYIA